MCWFRSTNIISDFKISHLMDSVGAVWSQNEIKWNEIDFHLELCNSISFFSLLFYHAQAALHFITAFTACWTISEFEINFIRFKISSVLCERNSWFDRRGNSHQLLKLSPITFIEHKSFWMASELMYLKKFISRSFNRKVWEIESIFDAISVYGLDEYRTFESCYKSCCNPLEYHKFNSIIN